MQPTVRARILLVEDEKAAAELLQRHLELSGFKAHTEGTGQTALRYAAENPPDLVILDLKLPDISGYEVCKQLRKMFRERIPTLILTALVEPIDQLKGFAFGADAYLTKPVKLKELMETITTLLGEPPSRPSPAF